MDSIIFALIWILFIEVFSFAIFPALSLFFSGLADKGFAISKFLGILIAAYITWLLASIHFLPFSRVGSIIVSLIVIFGFFFISFLNTAIKVKMIKDKKIEPQTEDFVTKLEKVPLIRNYIHRLQSIHSDTLHESDEQISHIIIIEEIIFIAGFLIWIYLRGILPDIMGTEKFMDFGIMNAILKSAYFPPHDMWLSGFSLNYYYFGQYIFSFITQISGVPSSFAYNFSIATIYALSFILSFSLLVTLSRRKIASFIGSFILTSGGNIYFAYQWLSYLFSHKGLQGFSFWYPTATRLIPYTINEFPIYSFVVSDLHAHFTDIPIVLMSLSHSLNIFNKKAFSTGDFLIASLITGVMAVTNSWDALFYLSVLAFVLLFIYIIKPHVIDALHPLGMKEKLGYIKTRLNAVQVKNFQELLSLPLVRAIIDVCAVGLVAILLFLPFFLTFKAPVDGIGFNNIAHSDFGFILYLFGLFFFFILSYIVFLLYSSISKKPMHATDVFVLFLVVLGCILIILPEFFYLKDIFYKVNPPYFRANTVFKLYYQAWILFSIILGYTIARIQGLFFLQDLTRKVKALIGIWWIWCAIFLIASASYTFQAINEGYLNITAQVAPYLSCITTICWSGFKTDDGTSYITNQYADDAKMITWLTIKASPNAIIAEAVGDSYTYYARISANTGLATVLGWPNHEFQWRNTYTYSDERTKDMFALYTASSPANVHAIVAKYHINYIIVGQQERLKYPQINEPVLRQSGQLVYQTNSSYIIQTL